jgi:hypothetical protein
LPRPASPTPLPNPFPTTQWGDFAATKKLGKDDPPESEATGRPYVATSTVAEWNKVGCGRGRGAAQGARGGVVWELNGQGV